MCQARPGSGPGASVWTKVVARPWRVEGNMSGVELTRRVRQQYKFSDYFPTGIAALHKVNI